MWQICTNWLTKLLALSNMRISNPQLVWHKPPLMAMTVRYEFRSCIEYIPIRIWLLCAGAGKILLRWDKAYRTFSSWKPKQSGVKFWAKRKQQKQQSNIQYTQVNKNIKKKIKQNKWKKKKLNIFLFYMHTQKHTRDQHPLKDTHTHTYYVYVHALQIHLYIRRPPLPIQYTQL